MAEPIVESSAETVLNGAKTERIRVLHVDDDQDFLKVAKQCLETQAEFEVDTASSVEKAMKMMKEMDYDVVVSDYQMPDKDGLEFLKELRVKGNTVPFIVLTGKGREEVAVEALNLGADGYFNKMGRPETVYGEMAYGIRQTVGNRRAEQLFLKSEDKYRRLVETLREGIWTIDKESYTTFVNPRMADMLGYTADEMLGKPLFSFMDERGVEICKHLLERRKQGVEEQHDFEFLRKDGKRIYTTLETSPITDDNGNYVGALASVMDMTERKKAEEALLTSEEKHRVISGITADFLFSCVNANEEGFGIDWMAGATDKIFGYSAKEIKDEGCWKFTVQPQDLPTFEEKVTGLKPGQTSVCELRITHKDGSTRWIKVSSQVVKDSSNPANHRLFGACRDITERKKMGEEIKSLARFTSENPNPVFRISQDSRILFANDAGKALLKKLNCEVGGSVPTFLKNLTVETLKSKSRRSEESEIEGRNYGFYATPIIDRGYVNVYGIDITERIKAQGILKESEAKYRTLVEQSLQGIVIAQGVPPRLVFANPAMVRISGYTSEELASVPMERLIHPDDRAVFFTHLKERFEGKPTSSPNEYRAIRKDGKTTWIAISASRIEHDSQPAVQATFIEITDRKQATEKAERVSEEWKKTFDAISDFMFILDTDFRFVRVNKAICDALKKEPSELIGKRCFEVLHGIDKPWPNCPYKETFVTKKATTEEINDPHFGFPLLVTVSPIFDEKGEFSGVVHIAKDITKLKDTEEHLKKVNKRLEMIYENAMEGISIVDPKGNFVFVNKASAVLLGYDKNDLIGMNLSKFFDKEGLEKIRSETGKREKGKSERYELVFYTRDGEQRVACVSASPIWEEGGTYAGTEAIIMDITSQKKAEEELCRAMEKLGVMNEKLRVVGGLTRHDANNKLAAITGNAYLARKKLPGNSEVLDYLKQIEASVGQTVQIFDFARTYEMLGVEELAYVDVEKTVDEAVSLFSGLKGIKVTNDCHGLTVLADSLLRQLVYNLVDNSLRYGEKLSWIRVYYEEKNDLLNLICEDDGVGISQAAKPKLFDEGYSTGKGSGYGLYLIKRMLEVYSWTIEEKGELGKGAKFVITIPKAKLNEKENYQLS